MVIGGFESLLDDGEAASFIENVPSARSRADGLSLGDLLDWAVFDERTGT
jgi:hypothetical protein